MTSVVPKASSSPYTGAVPCPGPRPVTGSSRYWNHITPTVVGSDEAYARLVTPDAVLGLGSYAVTLGLAAMGGEDRAARRPWLPLALGAKVTFDALQAGRLAFGQWPRHRAFCSWCLLAAGATFAALPLAVPEAIEAWNNLTRGHEQVGLLGRMDDQG